MPVSAGFHTACSLALRLPLSAKHNLSRPQEELECTATHPLARRPQEYITTNMKNILYNYIILCFSGLLVNLALVLRNKVSVCCRICSCFCQRLRLDEKILVYLYTHTHTHSVHCTSLPNQCVFDVYLIRLNIQTSRLPRRVIPSDNTGSIADSKLMASRRKSMCVCACLRVTKREAGEREKEKPVIRCRKRILHKNLRGGKINKFT